MDSYQNMSGTAPAGQQATRYVVGRAGWDFQPFNLPLVSQSERIVKVTDQYRKGSPWFLVIGVIQVIFAILAAIGGFDSFAIAHGVFSVVLIVLGVYNRFTGQRRRTMILTTDRFVYRSMSTYAGLDHKHNKERTVWIRDIASVEVRPKWRNWLLIIALILLLIGFFSFTRDHSPETVLCLIYGIILFAIYVYQVFRLPLFYLRVRATRGGSWDYTISIPYQLSDDAFSVADTVMAVQAECCAKLAGNCVSASQSQSLSQAQHY
eukprot:ANDGO_05055.mRNA.1 hypothetical protein